MSLPIGPRHCLLATSVSPTLAYWWHATCLGVPRKYLSINLSSVSHSCNNIMFFKRKPFFPGVEKRTLFAMRVSVLAIVVLISIAGSLAHADEMGQVWPTQQVGAAQSGFGDIGSEEVIMHALSLMGIQYRWGGKNPEKGLDCSGFVSHVFREALGIVLPGTARAMSIVGNSVRKGELQPGDLVFFNTLKTAFSHVGIYLGDNRFIHAPRRGKSIHISSLSESYWAERFNGARRVVSQ